MDKWYLCEYCGQLLGSLDTFRRHLKTIHYRKTREHKCSMWLLNQEIGLNQKAFEVKSSLEKSKGHNILHIRFLRPTKGQSP